MHAVSRVSCFEHSGARRESDWNPYGLNRIPNDDGAAFTADDGFTSHQHQHYTRATPHAAHTVSESSFAPPSAPFWLLASLVLGPWFFAY